jgi:hypothetical protein
MGWENFGTINEYTFYWNSDVTWKLNNLCFGEHKTSIQCILPFTSNKTEKKSLTNSVNQNKIEINILIKGSFHIRPLWNSKCQ